MSTKVEILSGVNEHDLAKDVSVLLNTLDVTHVQYQTCRDVDGDVLFSVMIIHTIVDNADND